MQGVDEKLADVVNENDDKTIKDKLKEPGNEIDSASTVTYGNAKLSETAILLEEGDTVQVEDENMTNDVRQDENIKDN
ncbi:Hypothetical predicted protein [Olea europaea subsp. europaea]|uniref:Uncharacterized protein n=1 Tax=Olea europaea subsp. europaea TaxID=158383 RepID=A0A8S0SN38_OLEEU|nr:Hypothetical predicted protein [Olea europaea subsp. europaea]